MIHARAARGKGTGALIAQTALYRASELSVFTFTWDTPIAGLDSFLAWYDFDGFSGGIYDVSYDGATLTWRFNPTGGGPWFVRVNRIDLVGLGSVDTDAGASGNG